MNKRKVVFIASIILIVLTIISLIAVNVVNKQKIAKLDEEIRRSMTYEQVGTGDDAVPGTNYVKFDAFFLRDLNGDGKAESIRGTCREIGESDTLYMNLNVLTNGYLENGVITINSENMYFQTAIVKDTEIKNNYISSNTRRIELNNVQNGTQKLISGSVRSGDYSSTSKKSVAIGKNMNNYTKINSVTLTGTHVSDSGVRTQINKTVDFTVDWHGTTSAQIPNKKVNDDDNISQTKEMSSLVDESSQTVNIEFEVTTFETDNELNLKKAVLSGTLPKLNGYSATSLDIRGGSITTTYDASSGKFTATREAKVDSSGEISSLAYDSTYKGNKVNEWNIKATYPIDAYKNMGDDTIGYNLPIEVYYEGYNNTNSEFTNPYKSNTARATISVTYRRVQGEVALFEVTVGKSNENYDSEYFVSKKKPSRIYNNVSSTETNDTYIVKWYGHTGEASNQTMIMKETENGSSQVSDMFIKSNSSKESMEGLTTNKGIYFINATGLLGTDGWIKVYNDQTNELIETFTSDNWSSYNQDNPYIYSSPVNHIRIETSNVNKNSYIYVYNIKEIDDNKLTNKYSLSEFNNLSYIQSTLTGYIGAGKINTDIQQANYAEPMSNLALTIGKSVISTQKTEQNIISIMADANENLNYSEWTDGVFLVKMPKDIILLDINYVEINNPEVEIVSYETYKENGNYYLKIITDSDLAGSFAITADVNMTADPRKVTVTDNIELYATNEACENYEKSGSDTYDINGNGNTSENVAKLTAEISLTSPGSILTSQTASNYDNKGSIAVAPQIAIIDKEQKSIQMNINLTNNYSGTISDIQLLGRIPSVGNTYAISGNELGSTFDTTLTGPISVASGITVYYSTNLNATKEFNSQNNWVTANSVSDWSTIKSYLIDLTNYQMRRSESLDFTYGLTIPNGLEYNEVAYAHHGVYFNLDTEEGKYATYTEPNRLGIMVAKQFNMEITKYQLGKNTIVPGATYSVVAEGEEEGKTGITNTQGIATIRDLYVEKTYTIKEVKSPDEYELNTDEIKIKTRLDSTGNLVVEKISGNVKGNIEVEKQSGESYKVKLAVEDEIRANLTLTKAEKGNNAKLQGVKYKLTGYNIPEEGEIFETDSNGQIDISGISLNQEYKLEEIEANGYYLESVTFKVVKSGTNYSLQTISGNIKGSSVTLENDIPRVNIQIENEKIPTYNLELLKIESNDSEKKGIEGARYELTSVDTGKVTYYSTDINGKINLTGLYNYVDGKYITGEYILKETRAPEGYTLNSEEIRFKVQLSNGNLQAIIINESELTSVEEFKIENGIAKLTVKDEPIFKITKTDSETNEPLANAKFTIQQVDTNNAVIGYAKDPNGNYVGERDNQGRYVVTTNENGEITYPLAGGFYKIVEIEAPEGYELPANEADRTEYFTVAGFEDFRISYIEDLVELSNQVNSGTSSYSGKIVLLARTLDFNDDNSYRNPNDTSFGDYNGDGRTEGIKTELTKQSGSGFKPIGNGRTFNGKFLGQGYEIQNIYINSSQAYVGLFGHTSGADISGLGINGNIMSNATSTSIHIGGIVGYANNTKLTNVYNEANLTAITTGDINIGGISGYNGIINKSYNTGDIKISNSIEISAGGISGNANEINDCYNKGDIIATNIGGDYIGGIEGYASNITNCYNEGNITIDINNPRGIAIGGVAGSQRGDMKNTYNSGNITVNSSVSTYLNIGGIFGYGLNGNIKYSYNIGNIELENNENEEARVGGISGTIKETTVSKCYNAGEVKSVSGYNDDTIVGSYAGGISGFTTDLSSIYNC